jgi:hypothetical protein
MKRCAVSIGLVSLVASACWIIAVAASADDAPKPQTLPQADDDGWRALFDGKTLTNWKSTKFGGEGEVYAQDGVLGFDMGNPLTGVTWIGAELPKVNYEVHFEARKVQGGDFFCALTFPVQDDHLTLVLGGWGGAVIGLSSIDGFDASENETTDYYTFKKEQWYKVRVKVTDKVVQCWIDGESISNVEYAGKRLSTRIEVDDSKPFGICSFETQGEVRNLKLRQLDKK